MSTTKPGSPLVLTAAILFAGVLSALVSACSPASSGKSANEDAATGILKNHVIANFDLAGSRKVALTFDDGPSTYVTPMILDLLKEQGVHATFFMVGKNIPGREALLIRMGKEGHVLGNHTYSHASFREERFQQNPELAADEVRAAHNLLKPFLSHQKRPYFRPAGGSWGPTFAPVLNSDVELSTYVGPIFWNVGGVLQYDVTGEITHAADWACWSQINRVPVETCLQGYLRSIDAQGGGVVLMHDIFPNTVALARQMILALKQQGYEFVTLDQMPLLDRYDGTAAEITREGLESKMGDQVLGGSVK